MLSSLCPIWKYPYKDYPEYSNPAKEEKAVTYPKCFIINWPWPGSPNMIKKVDLWKSEEFDDPNHKTAKN
ncbi:MAG: hypothetical protein CL662_01710 [Bacteroidetes bacterium]|nr:hypothetical protein [Bacteroidota bacterium]